MKKILAWLGSTLFFLTSVLGTVSCSSNEKKMTEEYVTSEIMELAESGITYEGDFVFDPNAHKDIKEQYFYYLKDSTWGGRTDNPSSFTKLVTKTFLEKLRQQAPKIFKDYPSFTLECSIQVIPEKETLINFDNFEVKYAVLYNLDPLNEITHLCYGDWSDVDMENPVTHPNLDNFIGKNASRMTEYIVDGLANGPYSFNFKQKNYLRDSQKRIDFLLDLYGQEMKPIQFFPGQSYDALNMFNTFKVDYQNLPDHNILNLDANFTFIREEIQKTLDYFLLKFMSQDNGSSLYAIKSIDSYYFELSFVNYLTVEQISNDNIWSKCVNTQGYLNSDIGTVPFRNGMMQFDIKIRFGSNKKISKKTHQERIFVNFTN